MVAARLPVTCVITYQTEWSNSLEGTRDFDRECTCSKLLFLSFLVSEKQSNKRYSELTAAAQTVRHKHNATCRLRRWWGKTGNVTPSKKLSSCTDCFLYKQRESVVVTDTYWEKQNVYSTKERKGKETLKYGEK